MIPHCGCFGFFVAVFCSVLVFAMQLMGSSLVAQRLKRLPSMQDTWVRSLGWEDPLEEGMATHSSILSYLKNPHGQRSLAAIVHGVTKSQTRLSD